MKKPSTLEQAVLPIKILKLLLGCAIITENSNIFKLLINIFYTVILWSCYCSMLYKKIIVFTAGIPSDVERTGTLIVLYSQNCVMFINILWEITTRKKRRDLLKHLAAIDKTLLHMGADINYWAMFLESFIVVSVWFIVSLVFNVMMLFWDRTRIDDPIQNFCTLAILVHPIHINALLETIYVVSMRTIESRLYITNKILETIFTKECRDKFFQYSKKKCLVICTIRRKLIEENKYDSKIILQVIKHAHLELGIIAQDLTEMTGVKLTMATASTFILFTNLLYGIYVQFSDLSEFTLDSCKIIVPILWLIHTGYRFFWINSTCSSTINRYHKARAIIHDLEMIIKNPEFQDETRQFSLQIMHNNLSFEPCGLFTLGYDLIRNVASNITTLVIILIQMRETQPGSI